jgi:glycine/D-amino acid oxidase-like deaminating enzyme
VIGTEALRSDERPSPQDCPPDMARAAAAQRSLKEVGYGRSQADVAQACVRPMSPDGVPIVGKLFGNVYIATGGGPWGITWGPLMGKSLASLINDDDDPPIRLGPLKPERFDTLIYQQLLKFRAPETKIS